MSEVFTATIEQLAWCPACGDSMELQEQKDLTAKELYLCFGCDQLYLFTKVEEDKK